MISTFFKHVLFSLSFPSQQLEPLFPLSELNISNSRTTTQTSLVKFLNFFVGNFPTKKMEYDPSNSAFREFLRSILDGRDPIEKVRNWLFGLRTQVSTQFTVNQFLCFFLEFIHSKIKNQYRLNYDKNFPIFKPAPKRNSNAGINSDELIPNITKKRLQTLIQIYSLIIAGHLVPIFQEIDTLLQMICFKENEEGRTFETKDYLDELLEDSNSKHYFGSKVLEKIRELVGNLGDCVTKPLAEQKFVAKYAPKLVSHLRHIQQQMIDRNISPPPVSIPMMKSIEGIGVESYQITAETSYLLESNLLSPSHRNLQPGSVPASPSIKDNKNLFNNRQKVRDLFFQLINEHAYRRQTLFGNSQTSLSQQFDEGMKQLFSLISPQNFRWFSQLFAAQMLQTCLN
jgi:hypothetical protein